MAEVKKSEITNKYHSISLGTIDWNIMAYKHLKLTM